VLTAAAGVGFAFFLMELVWYRMLAPLLGGSTYTFGLILAVALAGVGLGSAAYARSGPAAAKLSSFAATCALEALCLAVPYALGDRIAVLAAQIGPKGAFALAGYAAGWSLVAAIVVFPASFVAGYQFPLLIALLGKGDERVGTDVGLAYFWNTAGGIAGSLAGGFGLLPMLSATGTWVFVVCFLCALGLLALLPAGVGGGAGWKVRAWFPIGTAALSLSLLLATGPTAAWRHGAIGAGRVNLRGASANAVEEWLRDRRRQLAWQADGLESSVAVLKKTGGYAFAIGGKTDGSVRDDAPTGVMGGLVGAALSPEPRRALVIGLGTGETAGWLGALPGLERVDVVELEPAILRVARDCAPANQNVLSNPKVRVVIGDAREFLLTSRETYDFIFSEPSNPYRVGISSLFTEDFYRAARARLKPGGIFLQWLQAYEVDAVTVRTVYRTLLAAFPEVETWFTRPVDMLLVASGRPIVYDVARLSERLQTEPFATAMEQVWRSKGVEGFLSHHLGRSSLARELAAEPDAAENTDDRNLVEFGFARSLGQHGSFNVDDLRRRARSGQEDTPAVSGNVDWAAVDRWRIAAATADGEVPTVDPGVTGEALRQALAQKTFIEEKDGVVLANWRARPWEPVGSIEELVVAEALAQGGDEGASSWIDRLRPSHPVEADLLLGRLRWRQGRAQEAVEAFERAFAACRRDPWPFLTAVRNSFPIVHEIAMKDERLAGRLCDALAHPFAVALLEDERRLLRLDVASRVGPGRYAEVVDEMEPNVPWRWGILELRARAYAETGNPRANLAKRELDQFMDQEPRRPVRPASP
jgi:spermidine synthase